VIGLVAGAGAQEPPVAQEESNRQTEALVKEIESATAAPTKSCSKAKQAADAANQAKSRYITPSATSCARR
jgi:hypothetical protein